MALPVNSTMTFLGYDVIDLGISMRFVCLLPGAGQPTDYSIVLTDAELAGVSTQPQLATLVRTKLERKFRATNIASKLDPFIGQSLVI